MFRQPTLAADTTNKDIERSLQGKSVHELMALAERYKRVAMYVLENPQYHQALGGYDEKANKIYEAGESYYAKNFNQEYLDQIRGTNYVRLAAAHSEAKDYILAHLSHKLSSQDVRMLQSNGPKLK